MMKIKGACNRCGSCCGYKFEKVALPRSLFEWDKQHPDDGLRIVKLIKEKTGDDFVNRWVKIYIKGVGNIKLYLSKDGIQRTDNDKTCPFYDKEDRKCIIWDTEYIPKICKETPQNMTRIDKIEKWQQNHQGCGFYWIEDGSSNYISRHK